MCVDVSNTSLCVGSSLAYYRLMKDGCSRREGYSCYFSEVGNGGLVSVLFENLDLNQIHDDITTSEMKAQRK